MSLRIENWKDDRTSLHYDRENRQSVIIMTLKESVLQGIETADEKLLEDLLQLIRSRTPKTITLSETIAIYRKSAIDEGLNIDPDEIWDNV